MKTVKVKMLVNVAGTPAYAIGQIVDLDAALADVWIREGMAARLVRGEAEERGRS
ncbi:MAG TPA: hypothetical protein VFA59_06620 [Vicinamibacterales bacterium]|nr:hypothetical protein [Vicinamibacterales bacterium]